MILSEISIENFNPTKKMSSPLNFLNFYKPVFKFYGAFEIETDLKFLKRLMLCYTIGYQSIFTYLGCFLFILPLFWSSLSKEMLQILFMAFAVSIKKHVHFYAASLISPSFTLSVYACDQCVCMVSWINEIILTRFVRKVWWYSVQHFL